MKMQITRIASNAELDFSHVPAEVHQYRADDTDEECVTEHGILFRRLESTAKTL